MQRRKYWQELRLGVLGWGLVGLSGCLQTAPSEPPVATPQTIPIAQTEPAPTALANPEPRSVSFHVCGNITDWERPDWEEQTAELASNPRYADGLETEPLKSLFDKFWTESVITFTTYGLSARVEPIYLSGVWTVIDAMDACYSGDRPDAIVQGEMAEMWLIGHRVVDMTWSGDQYQVTVEPTVQGLQFVQFERLETSNTLPIVVLAVDGTEVTVASGDW